MMLHQPLFICSIYSPKSVDVLTKASLFFFAFHFAHFAILINCKNEYRRERKKYAKESGYLC